MINGYVTEELFGIQSLSHQLLGESYNKAIELGLNEDFILLLRSEMKRREFKH